MVECSGFENQRGFTVTGGSNPSLSVIKKVFEFLLFLWKKQIQKLTSAADIYIYFFKNTNFGTSTFFLKQASLKKFINCIFFLFFWISKKNFIFSFQKLLLLKVNVFLNKVSKYLRNEKKIFYPNDIWETFSNIIGIKNYEFSLFTAGEIVSVVDKTYFAKKRAWFARFSTFCFQAFLRIFFFDFDVRFCYPKISLFWFRLQNLWEFFQIERLFSLKIVEHKMGLLFCHQ